MFPWTIVLTLLFTSCSICQKSANGHLACRDDDSECLKQASRDHVIQRQAYWSKMLARPVQERLYQAPAEMIDYVLLQNRMQGFPERPQMIAADPAFVADFKIAMNELPQPVKKLLSNKLLAIFLGQDLGGSAITDVIRDEQGKEWGAFIVFDQKQLQRMANEWATWKEASVFEQTHEWSLQMTIAEKKNNTRARAISFILLHELGHVLAIGEDFHPPWDGRGENKSRVYPFTELAWPGFKSFMTTYSSRYDQTSFTLRPRLRFYQASPPMKPHEVLPVYQQLRSTNFVTLYGATNPGDDFAEAFATYVHNVMLKRPYYVSILNKGQEVERFGLCWSQKRCRPKRVMLEKFINSKGE